MKKYLLILLSILLITPRIYSQFNIDTIQSNKTNPPIYIAFLWHMHQPIYWPYENIIQTEQNNRYPFSVIDIHNQRTGPYTSWPKNAIMKGITANLGNFGAQVSFSGSLIENLNNLESSGNINFQNWKNHWNFIKNQKTILQNPRMDMLGFGYFHPLMPLIDYSDIRRHIQKHKFIFNQYFPGNYSKGLFPPENAFSIRMIPSLVDEGFNWVLVDNIHFDRASTGYPYSTSANILEPNKSDVQNPNPNDWIQLHGLWAPTQNSARWGRQPHYAEYIDPNTGEKKKIIVVPADRYLGNEDGRGGFGALNYEAVLSQLEQFNTDLAHPILVVLHHDGDNYGGGSESYYHNNFQNFVNWLLANPTRFVCTTIEDYLEMYPPDSNDVIHIEDGSWSGADNGDPEFKKWLGDPDQSGYSPDRNSWAVVTAAKNIIETALSIAPNNENVKLALNYLLVAQSSDYWYWDGSLNGIWDSHPTRACNQAIELVQNISGVDTIGPTIFLPQREPYNPGETEFGIPQPNNVKIWSFIYDKSGLKSVKLKYRIDFDGINSRNSIDNEIYFGGPEVSPWYEISMIERDFPSLTNPTPLVKAKEFSAEITELQNKLIDYYIEAIDSLDNVTKSPILHVWIGNSTPNIPQRVSWSPKNPTKNDTITITVSNSPVGARLHWGVNYSGNNWQTPSNVYWTPGTSLYNGIGPAVESPMVGPDSTGTLFIKIGPFNNPNQIVNNIAFVIHFNDNTWDNNNGLDYHINLGNNVSFNFVMDGIVDSSAIKIASSNNFDLYAGWNGADLYVATQSAQTASRDVFIFITDSLHSLVNAPWLKNGKVVRWSAYLGNESTNNWSGWFDAFGSNNNYAGNFLEGTLNIQNEFQYVPERIYLAVGHFETPDGGSLIHQIPAGDGDGDIEVSEFIQFSLNLTNVPSSKTNLTTPEPQIFIYPNPFNSKTTVEVILPLKSNFIKEPIQVFNSIGQLVKSFNFNENNSRIERFEFNGSDLPSGIYFIRFNFQHKSYVYKIVLLK